MPIDAIDTRSTDIWRCRVVAGLLILGAAALHLAYFAHDCPLDLAPDEAHYWDWSRHLDWSYYSKGPLVAYLIRGGCLLAESLAQDLTGNAMLAVRLPAVLCGSLLLVSLYILTVQVFGRERLAALVVALALTMPMLVAGSSLMTIDAPFTCCWGWALVLGYRAIFQARNSERGARSAESSALRSALRAPSSAFQEVPHSALRAPRWVWPVAGLVVGIGILAKYTMVLWLGSVGLFLLASPTYRRLLLRPGFWIMTGVAALCSLPILVWNVHHDWVTLRHVHGLTGLEAPAPIAWHGPFLYLGAQCGLLLIFWFIAWLAAMIAHRPSVERDEGIRYLWWLSAPTFLVFLLFSPKTAGGEPNWPVTAHLSGLVLTVAWLARQLQAPRVWYARLTAAFLATTCVIGLAISLLMHHTEQVYPLLTQWVGPPTAQQPFPLRRVDPTCRLRGWRTLAAEVDQIRAELRAEGIEPVLAAGSWALPGELGFYCAGHPTVYSVGLAQGDRRSQYDFWRPNPVWDPEEFRGRTFIIVGLGTAAQDAFERVEPGRLVTHHEGGQPISCWSVTVCRGFRGFRPVGELLGLQHF